MPWHKIHAFHSVKPVSKSKGKIKHVHSSFAFHMTVVVILCLFQRTFFYAVLGPKVACFPFLLFLVVGKISVYIFSFFVCCLALVDTECVTEWRIFVNDSSSPFFFMLSIHIRTAHVTCVSVFDCPQSSIDLCVLTYVMLLLKGLFISYFLLLR